MRGVARLLVYAIKVYQWTLSPLLGANCRHLPTCSAYAVEALERHGVAAGLWLSLKRLLRCNPWVAGGYDPVPERTARCGHGHADAGGRPPAEIAKGSGA